MEVLVRGRPEARAERATRRGGTPVAPAARSRDRAVLQLQRAAGNRAVSAILQPPVVQRDNDSDAKTDETTVYRRRLTAAATDAGLSSLAGFDPAQINLAQIDRKGAGTAKPGLNLTLEDGAKTAHTGWVDDAGKYPVNLDLSAGVPAVHVTMIVTAGALHEDKTVSIATIRHEMVHVRHHLITLDALKQWDGKGGLAGFKAWLKKNQKRVHLSDIDKVLITEQAENKVYNTEVLGYVQGFVNQYHLAPATKDGSAVAFAELLGAVQTSKYDIWSNADSKVKDEAMSQLRAYFATLDAAHQGRWKQWLTDEGAKSGVGADRKDFYTRLAAFVK